MPRNNLGGCFCIYIHKTLYFQTHGRTQSKRKNSFKPKQIESTQLYQLTKMTKEYRAFLYEIMTPLMAALIVVLNILEMFYILKEKRNRRKQGVGTIYIINLCSSDIFVGIAMIVLKVISFL